MDSFMEIWKIIVTSNTFNFAIFALILIFVAKKIDINKMISKLQEDIQIKIDNAKSTKSSALEDLRSAENSIKNLDIDIKKMLGEAEDNAEILSKKIFDETEEKIRTIENNAKKVIDAEEKTLTSDLTAIASEKSLNLALNHIKKTLDANLKLHDKYINESIEALDGLKF